MSSSSVPTSGFSLNCGDKELPSGRVILENQRNEMQNDNDTTPVPQSPEVDNGIRNSVEEIDANSRLQGSSNGRERTFPEPCEPRSHGQPSDSRGRNLAPRNTRDKEKLHRYKSHPKKSPSPVPPPIPPKEHMKQCHNCGSFNHLARKCKVPTGSRFSIKTDAITASFHDMESRTKAAEDVAHEKNKEISDLEAELAKAKSTPKVEIKLVPEFDLDCHRIAWAEKDPDHKYIDFNDNARYTLPRIKFSQVQEGENVTNTSIIFKKPDMFSIASAVLCTLTAIEVTECSYYWMKTLSAVRDNLLIYFKDQVFKLTGRSVRVANGYSRPPTQFSRSLITTFMLIIVLMLWRALRSYNVWYQGANILHTFKYFLVDFEHEIENPDQDYRADAIAAGSLTHPNPQNHKVKFSTVEMTSFLGLFALVKRTKRKNTVSIETITQLTSPNNIVLSSTDKVAWDRIQYTNTHLHSVNLNRYHTLNDEAIDVDSQLVAYGRRREILQQRSCDDFHRGTPE